MNVTMPSWSTPAAYVVDATGAPGGAFGLAVEVS
jgi:hypothetical protein